MDSDLVTKILLFIVFAIPVGSVIVYYVKMSPAEKSALNAETQARREAIKNPVNADGDVVCPFCGSKQIQAVPRRWSATAGLLTNKIDRVCLRCKRKF
jgi:hypothetical protein